MISQETIDSVVDDIVKKCKPLKIILFGSYARGNTTEDNDIDLLIILNMRGTSSQKIRRVRSSVTREGFGLDVVVRSPARLRKALAGRDWFIQEAVRDGRVLYER
ncbi:MAG: nucleotidyltransferase domain-containing protein [Ignavibacteriae bacterium]|nr:nucleotidyltransferase domain-containing protein [Ignavibacteriota bacterium]